MCLKQRRQVNKKAERSGFVAASRREKIRIEKRGPLY
jgi:hypothetical protein